MGGPDGVSSMPACFCPVGSRIDQGNQTDDLPTTLSPLLWSLNRLGVHPGFAEEGLEAMRLFSA